MKGEIDVKKTVVFGAVFALTFIVVYIVLCYSPWFALKLSAPPLEYFIASVKKLWYAKALISALLGTAAGTFTVYKLK